MNVVGIVGGSLLVLMIESTHTLHTYTGSTLYIYNAIQHLLQWLEVIRMMQHHIVTALWDLRVNVVGIVGGSLLVLMIESTHTLHTYTGSTLYIYNAIQHLLQWLEVIRMMQHHIVTALWDLRVSQYHFASWYSNNILAWN